MLQPSHLSALSHVSASLLSSPHLTGPSFEGWRCSQFIKCLPCVMDWMRWPPQSKILKICSPVGSCFTNLMRNSLAGSMSLGVGFEVSKDACHFKFALSTSSFLSSTSCPCSWIFITAVGNQLKHLVSLKNWLIWRAHNKSAGHLGQHL